MDKLTGTETAIAEFVMDGNVTWNILYIIFAVAVFTATFVWWVMHNFQTKNEATLAETRLAEALKADSEGHKAAIKAMREDFDEAVDGMHNHMKNMRDDNKSDLRHMQNELAGMRNSMTSVANDLGYLRAKAENKS